VSEKEEPVGNACKIGEVEGALFIASGIAEYPTGFDVLFSAKEALNYLTRGS
jgi:hypothetical protein